MRAVAATIFSIFVSGTAAHSADVTVYDWEGGSKGIILIGKLEKGDAAKFKEAVASIKSKGAWLGQVDTYVQGDENAEAMMIGEQIYALRANTVAPLDLGYSSKPKHLICQTGLRGPKIENYPGTHKGDARCACTGACFFVWASGRGRNGSAVGLRGLKFDPKSFGQLSTSDAEAEYNRVKQVQRAFLLKVGISEQLAELPFTLGSDEIRYLSTDEVKSLVGIASPYLKELSVAKCGQYTSSVNGSGQLRSAWWDCHYKLREQEARAAMRGWEK